MLRAVGEGVQAFWQDRMWLDYTIEVGEEQFRVHKLIMASVSDYFKAMLTGSMVESQTDRVRLQGQNPLAVSNIIEFIYTGQFGTTQVSTEELLACAMYLQIPPAIEVCMQLLCDKVNTQNAIDTLAEFKAYRLEDGIVHTVSYIKYNMDEILNVSNVEEMSQDKLQILLDCWVKSEWKLFVTIKEWINVDFQNRNQHLNNLMGLVRFALMTPEQLEDVKDIYCDLEGSWCKLVAEAEEYHKLPIHLQVLDESEQCTVRADPTPLCFTAEENSDGVFHALEETTWYEYEALNHPEVGFTVDASVVVNNFFIACKGQKWYVFDPRTKTWSSMTQMPVSKSKFGLVHCDKQLYIVGGDVKGTGESSVPTDSIERYNLETNNWSVSSSKMPVVLEGFSACSLDGFIYVAGGWQRIPRGQSRERKDLTTRMDCFDPTTKTWSSKAPVPESFQDCALQVMELCKEDIIFLMDYGFYMQCYRPYTDQWSAYDLLCGAHTNLVFNSLNSVLTVRNTFYFIDFFHDIVYMRGEQRDCRDDDGTTAGACEVWRTCEKGKKAIVEKLCDFPLDEYNEVGELASYFLALLALAPQSVDDD